MPYEAPIKLFHSEPITEKIKDETDELILQSVAKIGVIVNRDELVKALAYDRAEYERGLRDGMQIAEKEIRQAYDIIKDMQVKIHRLLQHEHL